MKHLCFLRLLQHMVWCLSFFCKIVLLWEGKYKNITLLLLWSQTSTVTWMWVGFEELVDERTHEPVYFCSGLTSDTTDRSDFFWFHYNGGISLSSGTPRYYEKTATIMRHTMSHKSDMLIWIKLLLLNYKLKPSVAKLTSRFQIDVFRQRWSFWNLPSAPSLHFVPQKEGWSKSECNVRIKQSTWIFSLHQLTHQDLQELLSLHLRRPAAPTSLQPPRSVACVSFLQNNNNNNHLRAET